MVHGCVFERERDSVCLCVCVCLREREWECVKKSTGIISLREIWNSSTKFQFLDCLKQYLKPALFPTHPPIFLKSLPVLAFSILLLLFSTNFFYRHFFNWRNFTKLPTMKTQRTHIESVSPSDLQKISEKFEMRGDRVGPPMLDDGINNFLPSF